MKRLLLSLVLLSIIFFNLQSQICSPPSAYAELDIGNCRVGLLNGGDFWWNGVDAARYEVPKIDPSSGATPLQVFFGGAIWLSALDNNNNLKMAGMTYRNQGYEFYPGPLSNQTGSTTFTNCNVFNRFFEIRKTEIQAHQNQSMIGLPIPLSQIPSNILEWPGKGNSHFQGYVIENELAPFHDYNVNGIYDPENGDYPKVIGDQSFFWVMNDVAGFHERFGGEPLGVEVHFLAHAFVSSTLLNTTIYECTVTNKSFGNQHDFYFGVFADPDIRDFSDDMVGCDTIRNASFFYDQYSGFTDHPISSIQFLTHDLSAFSVYVNSGPLTFQDPTTATEARNRMLGKFGDGSPYCANGSLATNCPPNRFMFPGNPDETLETSMCSQNQFTGNDYRSIQSVGPLALNAWEPIKVSWAVNTVFPDNYDGCPDIDVEIGNEIDQIANTYYNLLNSLNQLPTALGNYPAANNFIDIYPNPSNHQIQVESGGLNIKRIQILSIEGKIIKDLNYSIAKKAMDIATLAHGVYFLHIQTDQGTAVKKFLKN